MDPRDLRDREDVSIASLAAAPKADGTEDEQTFRGIRVNSRLTDLEKIQMLHEAAEDYWLRLEAYRAAFVKVEELLGCKSKLKRPIDHRIVASWTESDDACRRAAELDNRPWDTGEWHPEGRDWLSG